MSRVVIEIEIKMKMIALAFQLCCLPVCLCPHSLSCCLHLCLPVCLSVCHLAGNESFSLCSVAVDLPLLLLLCCRAHFGANLKVGVSQILTTSNRGREGRAGGNGARNAEQEGGGEQVGGIRGRGGGNRAGAHRVVRARTMR